MCHKTFHKVQRKRIKHGVVGCVSNSVGGGYVCAKS